MHASIRFNAVILAALLTSSSAFTFYKPRYGCRSCQSEINNGLYLKKHTITCTNSRETDRCTAPRDRRTVILRDTVTSAADVEKSSSESSNDDGGPEDAKEWKAIVSSFKMYKAAYGDLKVPSRFVVPSMPPWPSDGWGLKLGTKVAAIRSTGKYLEGKEAEERRQLLDDMGFLWRLRSASPDKQMDGVKFEQIYDALSTYKEKFGNVNVPASFVVPVTGDEIADWPEHTRGLPLGGKISTVRSKAYLKNKPEQREKLLALGLELDGKVAANSARYKLVYDALVRYKEIFGDLYVPQPFVVPQKTEDWPEDMWGLRLGARVNAIRSQGTFVNTEPSRKEELTALGFVWEQPADARRRGRKKKVAELDESLNGLLAEETPAEPEPSPKVAETLDVASGEDIFSTLFKNADGNPLAPKPKGNTLTDASAVIASQIARSSNAPSKKTKNPATVVNPIASETTDALKADIAAIIERDLDNLDGIELKDIWHLLTPDEQADSQADRNPRENIGWQFDDFDGYSIEDIVEALKHYQSLNGDFDVDSNFVVPSFNAESAAATAAAIAAVMEGEGDTTDLIAEDLMNLEAESDDEEWPAFFAGMKLGNMVSRIRAGDVEVKHIPETKAKFDSIGFDWGNEKLFLEAPYEKSLCAIWVFYQIRGDCCVDLEFRIPDEEPWPEALANFPLGHAINFFRSRQELFYNEYREKWRFLYRFDFLWLPAVEWALEKSFYEHYLDGLETDEE